MADTTISLTVGGSSYQSVNLEGIPCNAFRFERSTGGKMYPKVVFNRDLDGTTGILLRAATMGADFVSAEIEIDKSGPDGKPAPWSRITLGNGNFADDQLVGAPSGKKSERLVLYFTSLKFDDVHDANGQTTPPNGQPWGLDPTTNRDN